MYFFGVGSFEGADRGNDSPSQPSVSLVTQDTMEKRARCVTAAKNQVLIQLSNNSRFFTKIFFTALVFLFIVISGFPYHLLHLLASSPMYKLHVGSSTNYTE